MKAITLWPEWAWAILYLGKRVENRGWAIPSGVVGTPVAIHAGKCIGGRPRKEAREEAFSGVASMANRSGWHSRLQAGVLTFTKDGITIRTDETPILTSCLVGIARFGYSSFPEIPPFHERGELGGWGKMRRRRRGSCRCSGARSE